MVADPPEVTVGDAELTVGVDVDPAVLEDEVLAADEDATDDPPLTTAGEDAEPELEGTVAFVPVPVPVLLDPAWPWDTADPDGDGGAGGGEHGAAGQVCAAGPEPCPGSRVWGADRGLT